MATSTISNTILDLDGTAISGVVVVARLKPGPAFRADTGSEIASQDSTTTNSTGAWSLSLERNTNITPTGSYYEIEEQIPDANGGLKTWTISVGTNNQSLYAALITSIPAVSGPTYLTQASADARYAQLGSLGGGTPTNVKATASDGVGVTAARADHQHMLDSTLAGNALTLTSGILHVVPDGTNLEISSDTIRMKDDGTVLAKLSAQVRGGFIHYALYQAGVR